MASARPGGWRLAARWWLAATLACAALGLSLCRGPECAGGADAALLEWLAGRRHELLDRFFAAATWLGSIAVLLPLASAGALWLALRRRHGEAAFVVASVAGAAVLAQIAKLWSARPRPELAGTLIDLPADLSYPSAHAAQATAFAAALLALTVRRPAAPRRALWAAMLVLVGAVGLSRLYLQVHYPSDVAAGMILAAGWVLGLRALLSPDATERPT